MTIEEIRKGAPIGATHYEIDGRFIYYFKLKDTNLYIWNCKKGWLIKPIEWLVDTKPLN